MAEHNVTKLPQRVKAAAITMDLPSFPPGPFTVTVTGPDGTKWWEIGYLDAEGNSPPDNAAMGTGGPFMSNLCVNLLTGALRVFAGSVR